MIDSDVAVDWNNFVFGYKINLLIADNSYSNEDDNRRRMNSMVKSRINQL